MFRINLVVIIVTTNKREHHIKWWMRTISADWRLVSASVGEPCTLYGRCADHPFVQEYRQAPTADQRLLFPFSLKVTSCLARHFHTSRNSTIVVLRFYILLSKVCKPLRIDTLQCDTYIFFYIFYYTSDWGFFFYHPKSSLCIFLCWEKFMQLYHKWDDHFVVFMELNEFHV